MEKEHLKNHIEYHDVPGAPSSKSKRRKSDSVETKTTSEVETQHEKSLRPTRLKEYIGQKKLKNNLSLFIEASRKRSSVLDHCLFIGPPGLGKTTLAHLVANELQSKFHSVSAPALEKKGDLAALVTNLEAGDVLFIDEIHRLSVTVEEMLYSAMEDFALDIIIGQGPGARSVRIDLPPFTLIGATTRAGLLTHPLRDRFGIQSRLEYYEPKDLSLIVRRSASILNLEITDDGALELAKRSRGTPRIANRLLKRVRDYAEVNSKGIVNQTTAKKALDLLEVDQLGLDEMDRRILKLLTTDYATRAVGIDTISASIGEERGTLEDVYEPYLIQNGFIERTPRGRRATPKAYGHLNIKVPDSENGLFD
jgi:Holliday junction DNA helicase RuvB